MRKFLLSFKLAGLLILTLFMSGAAMAQTVTINGQTASVYATYTGNPSSTPFSVSNIGYAGGTGFSGGYSVEMVISGAAATAKATVTAQRCTTNVFGSFTSGTTSVYGVNVGPWNSATTYTLNTIVKAQTGTPDAGTLGTTGLTNPNGTYEILMGGAGGTNTDGYYLVTVKMDNTATGGTVVTTTFPYIMQNTVTNSNTVSASISTSGTSCSSRPLSSTLTLYEPHLGFSSTVTAQLYKNGVASGSPVTYADGGGYAAPGNIFVPFTTLPAITTNGTYYIRYINSYTNRFSATDNFGTNVYNLPIFTPTFYEADMTGTSPITYALAGGPGNPAITPNTAGTYLSTCQKTLVSVGPPAVYSQSPFGLTIAGTNNVSTVTTTAAIIRYTDATFVTAYTPSFSQTICSGTAVDGSYDLTTLFSAYMSSTSNTGYYKVSVSSTTNSCSGGALSSVYYIYWAGPPVGNFQIGDIFQAYPTWTNYGSAGNTVCTAIGSCESNLQIGNPAASGYTGSLTGVKFKLDVMSGTCGSPTWTNVFDGSGGTFPQYSTGTTGTWDNYLASVLSYCTYMQTHVAGCTFKTLYINQYENATVGTEFRLTAYIYDAGCSATPFTQVAYVLNNQGACKTGGASGITTLTNNVTVSVYPNPTTGKITVSLGGQEENTTISIYDLQGRELTVPVQKVSDSETEMNLSGLSKGIYILGINGQKISKRVIVE